LYLTIITIIDQKILKLHKYKKLYISKSLLLAMPFLLTKTRLLMADKIDH